jgi:lipid A ethanolaminephosphotransferase
VACLARLGHVGAHARGTDCPTEAPTKNDETPIATPGFDAAMLFVSDHGESLGEKGLYLHGAPYAIAPDEQTHVPMLLWASRGFAERRRLDFDCVRARADRPLSHDHFFHSVLALADVRTRERKPELDLFAECAPAG